MVYSDQATNEAILSAFGLGDESWSFGSPPVVSSGGQWIPPHAEIAHVIAHAMSEIPQVSAVFMGFESDIPEVWTVLSKRDHDAKDRVYEKELEICKRLGLFGIDFKATSADLVSPQELTKDRLVQVFAR